MNLLLETALSILRNGGRCVLALILNSSGSTPRGEGADMLVLENGTIRGTIGGGALEGTVINTAHKVLADSKDRILEFDLSGGDTAAGDAICGGQSRVCLYLLNEKDLPVLEKLHQATANSESLHLALWQQPEGMRLLCITGRDKLEVTGAPAGLLPEILHACQFDGIHENHRLIYHEILTPNPRLWLMGGGHVAQATAQVAAVAGFDLIVVDDRAEFSNPERFPGARCIVCGQYDELPPEEVANTDYIVVVTRGHHNDREALRWALNTSACYVGMIGSRSKRDSVYEALMTQGVSRARLEWVHSPIGLPIGGRTPGDIAVSIVAELISVRSELSQRKEQSHGKTAV